MGFPYLLLVEMPVEPTLGLLLHVVQEVQGKFLLVGDVLHLFSLKLRIVLALYYLQNVLLFLPHHLLSQLLLLHHRPPHQLELVLLPCYDL